MNSGMEEYDEKQKSIQKQYLELIQTYDDLPCATRPSGVNSNLQKELDRVECAFLDTPPVHVDENGSARVCAKGLIPPTPADVAALQRANVGAGDFEVVDRSRWMDLIQGPDATDLSGFVNYILYQDGIGSCASEAITQAVMILHAIATGGVPKKLNPWFVYQEVSGGRDRGSSLPSNVAFVKEHGVASMEVWPRDKGWSRTPSREAFEDAKNHVVLEVSQVRNWDEFASALLYGWPVYFGYQGHAILATKLIDEQRLKYANSWGTNWGDAGFGTLHKDRIYWYYEVFALRLVTHTLPK